MMTASSGLKALRPSVYQKWDWSFTLSPANRPAMGGKWHFWTGAWPVESGLSGSGWWPVKPAPLRWAVFLPPVTQLQQTSSNDSLSHGQPPYLQLPFENQDPCWQTFLQFWLCVEQRCPAYLVLESESLPDSLYCTNTPNFIVILDGQIKSS